MPKTKQPTCKATIEFGDDHGVNTTTFHCQRSPGHQGRHVERGDMGYRRSPLPYALHWSSSYQEWKEVRRQMMERAGVQAN